MDDKPNKRLILLIVLGVFAIFSLIRGIVTPAKSRRSASPEQATVVYDRAVEKDIPAKRNAAKSKYANWGRNPFSLQPIKISEGPILNGIMWDKEKPLAVINNEIVKKGDNVSGNTVVDIKQDGVILNDGAKDFELKLEQ